jgi:lytic murein transglycosylase
MFWTLRIATVLVVALVAAPIAAEPAIDLDACRPALHQKARAAGLAPARLDALLAGVQPDASVLERLDAQPEFTTPIWDYLAALVDAERIADGRAKLREHAELLARIEADYGVDPASVVAVWGVESDFGQDSGGRVLQESLLALACAGRRQAYFSGELVALLKLIDAGDLRPTPQRPLRGSWAGAFGQTQFMPSTYARLAVDYDGDGRRDLVDSAADALASTAHFLREAGWRRGEAWGFEVRLPQGFQHAGGRRGMMALSAWAARGLKRADGSALVGTDAPAERRAGLLRPAGNEGPAFLVFRNFEAFYRYNAAESYALAIAHLSDRLRGGGEFVRAWPTEDPGLSRAQRRELQRLLIARGHDIGEVDGRLGTLSRRAIAEEQKRLGWASADGRGGQKILRALRESAPPR